MTMATSKKHVPEKSADDVKELPRGARVPQVFASKCPANPEHKKTRVYGKRGTIRYCCCDDCGETWKQSGPEPTEK